MRGQFWCKFGFCSSRKVWVMTRRGYGLREVWVKRASTVAGVIRIGTGAESGVGVWGGGWERG